MLPFCMGVHMGDWIWCICIGTIGMFFVAMNYIAMFQSKKNRQIYLRISSDRRYSAVSCIFSFADPVAFGSMPAGLRHMDAALCSDPGGDSEQTPEQAGILRQRGAS